MFVGFHIDFYKDNKERERRSAAVSFLPDEKIGTGCTRVERKREKAR